MGEGDVLYCVQVSLTGTTVALFWGIGVWLGIGLDIVNSLCTLTVVMGALQCCFVMGPRPGNVAKGI